MKKLFSVLAVLFVLGTTSVFAKGTTGIGAQAGFTAADAGYSTGALTFKVSKVPCVFAVDVWGFNGDLGVGLTADWWIANPTISGIWKYYYGIGLAAGFNTASSTITIGARPLVGTNIFLINGFLELYLQAAWQPYLYLGNSVGFVAWNLPVNAGFRFWF